MTSERLEKAYKKILSLTSDDYALLVDAFSVSNRPLGFIFPETTKNPIAEIACIQHPEVTDATSFESMHLVRLLSGFLEKTKGNGEKRIVYVDGGALSLQYAFGLPIVEEGKRITGESGSLSQAILKNGVMGALFYVAQSEKVTVKSIEPTRKQLSVRLLQEGVSGRSIFMLFLFADIFHVLYGGKGASPYKYSDKELYELLSGNAIVCGFEKDLLEYTQDRLMEVKKSEEAVIMAGFIDACIPAVNEEMKRLIGKEVITKNRTLVLSARSFDKRLYHKIFMPTHNNLLIQKASLASKKVRQEWYLEQVDQEISMRENNVFIAASETMLLPLIASLDYLFG